MLAGVIMLSAGREGLSALRAQLSRPSEGVATRVLPLALLCALCYALSFLFMREATLTVGEGGFLWRGAWATVVSTGLQAVLLGLWLLWREPQFFSSLRENLRGATVVGATSAAGSMAWFSAFALENASYVRAVGQSEVIFTLLIATLYFKERLTRLEIAGVVTTLAGVGLFAAATA